MAFFFSLYLRTKRKYMDEFSLYFLINKENKSISIRETFKMFISATFISKILGKKFR